MDPATVPPRRGFAVHKVTIPITVHTKVRMNPLPHNVHLYTFGSGIKHRDYIDFGEGSEAGVLSINHPVTELDCQAASCEDLAFVLRALFAIEQGGDAVMSHRERMARSMSARAIEAIVGSGGKRHAWAGNGAVRDGRRTLAGSDGIKLARQDRSGLSRTATLVLDPSAATAFELEGDDGESQAEEDHAMDAGSEREVKEDNGNVANQKGVKGSSKT